MIQTPIFWIWGGQRRRRSSDSWAVLALKAHAPCRLESPSQDNLGVCYIYHAAPKLQTLNPKAAQELGVRVDGVVVLVVDIRDAAAQALALVKALRACFSEASEGGMKVGRIKDPLYKDYDLGISHLPSPHLLRIPMLCLVGLRACGEESRE